MRDINSRLNYLHTYLLTYLLTSFVTSNDLEASNVIKYFTG